MYEITTADLRLKVLARSLRRNRKVALRIAERRIRDNPEVYWSMVVDLDDKSESRLLYMAGRKVQ